MQYRYRVLGKVEQSFILRGAYFAIGSEIDFYITESELSFVKERCKLDSIIDLVETAKPKNSMSVANDNSKSEKAKKQPYTAQKEIVRENVQPKAELPSKKQYTKRNSVSAN